LNKINENNNDNENYKNKSSFGNINKNKSIKLKINMDSFPFLLMNKADSKKNFSFKKLCSSHKTSKKDVIYMKNNKKDNYIKLQINNKENDNDNCNNNLRTKRNKRMNTFNNAIKRKNELITEKDEKDESIEDEKSIENFQKKKNVIEKNKLNELLSINNKSNTDSNTERTEIINMIGNAISTCEISNMKKESKDQDYLLNQLDDKGSYKTIKSSYKTLEGKSIYNSTNVEINNTNSYIINRKQNFFRENAKILKNNKKLELLPLNIKDNNNYKFNSKILLTKRVEKTNLNLTPIKNYKNNINVNIQKYVNYLLSNELEYGLLSSTKKNLSPLKSRNKYSLNKSEEKTTKNKTLFNKSRSINNNNNNIKLEYKTINGSHLRYLTNDIFTFNSGNYNLPLMSQVFYKTNEK
jgi:hypothetical protein